jgi:hypothetical protein
MTDQEVQLVMFLSESGNSFGVRMALNMREECEMKRSGIKGGGSGLFAMNNLDANILIVDPEIQLRPVFRTSQARQLRAIRLQVRHGTCCAANNVTGEQARYPDTRASQAVGRSRQRLLQDSLVLRSTRR